MHTRHSTDAAQASQPVYRGKMPVARVAYPAAAMKTAVMMKAIDPLYSGEDDVVYPEELARESGAVVERAQGPKRVQREDG
jgi:hypothetical protein